MKKSLKNIFIADDDVDDIELFAQALSEVSEGTKLSVAVNGEAMMKMLAECAAPDIIVLDMNMPYMNGNQCLDEIRSQKKYDQVPVIILSTSNRVLNIKQTNPGALNFFYKKPWKYPELKSLIYRICTGINRPEQ